MAGRDRNAQLIGNLAVGNSFHGELPQYVPFVIREGFPDRLDRKSVV